MEMTELLNQVSRLISTASTRNQNGHPDDATRSLVELRELLNAQPELEAGGALEEPTKPIET